MSLSDPDYNTQVKEAANQDLTQGDYMAQLAKSTPDDAPLPLSKYGGEKWAKLNDGDGQEEVTVDANEGDRVRVRRQEEKASEALGTCKTMEPPTFALLIPMAMPYQ
jgi:hypothetical protein